LDARPCAEDRIAVALADVGWAVTPDFLDPSLVDELEQECRRSWRQGEFRPAAIGRGEEREVRRDVRGDVIRWIDGAGGSDARLAFLGRLEALRRAINRETYLGLYDFEGHFAVYPPGTYYRRHLDRFRDGVLRVVSCILYLNTGWTPADGGCLRLYVEDTPGGHVDVEPRGGTFAVFLSDRFEHEVLPAVRERASWTGWFRRRPLD
jgi:SM-20-related protein